MSVDAVHNLNVFLGLGAIILQILSVLALLTLFFTPKEKNNVYLDFIKKHFLILGFSISFLSTIFPLVYSEVIHFLPCVLCWWQRIFIFPTFILFAVAVCKKYVRKNKMGDYNLTAYLFPLLSLGFLVSLYQNFFYYFGENSALPCDATGVSCYQRLVSEFGGYISIPMLALTGFFSLLTILIVAHFYMKES
jgi:disulfide bond formation protein DsbB